MGSITNGFLMAVLYWALICTSGAYATQVVGQVADALGPPMPQPPNPAPQPPPPPTVNTEPVDGIPLPQTEPGPEIMDTAGRTTPKVGDFREYIGGPHQKDPKSKKRKTPEGEGGEGVDKNDDGAKSEDEDGKSKERPASKSSRQASPPDQPEPTANDAPDPEAVDNRPPIRADDLPSQPTPDPEPDTMEGSSYAGDSILYDDDRTVSPGFGGVQVPEWLGDMFHLGDLDEARVMRYFFDGGGTRKEYTAILPRLPTFIDTPIYKNLTAQIFHLLVQRGEYPELPEESVMTDSGLVKQPSGQPEKSTEGEGENMDISSGAARMNLQSRGTMTPDPDVEIDLVDRGEDIEDEQDPQPGDSLARVIQLTKNGDPTHALLQQSQTGGAPVKTAASSGRGSEGYWSTLPSNPTAPTQPLQPPVSYVRGMMTSSGSNTPSNQTPTSNQQPGPSHFGSAPVKTAAGSSQNNQAEGPTGKSGKPRYQIPPTKKEDRQCNWTHDVDNRVRPIHGKAYFYRGYTMTLWPTWGLGNNPPEYQPPTDVLVGGLTHDYTGTAQENTPKPFRLYPDMAVRAVYDRVTSFCLFFRAATASYVANPPYIIKDHEDNDIIQQPLHPHFRGTGNDGKKFNFKTYGIESTEKAATIFVALTYIMARWMEAGPETLDSILNMVKGSMEEYHHLLQLWKTLWQDRLKSTNTRQGRRAKALLESGMLQEELSFFCRAKTLCNRMVRTLLLIPDEADTYITFISNTRWDGEASAVKPMTQIEKWMSAGETEPVGIRKQTRIFGDCYNWMGLLWMDCRDRLVWENFHATRIGATIPALVTTARQTLSRRPLEGPLHSDPTLPRPGRKSTQQVEITRVDDNDQPGPSHASFAPPTTSSSLPDPSRNGLMGPPPPLFAASHKPTSVFSRLGTPVASKTEPTGGPTPLFGLPSNPGPSSSRSTTPTASTSKSARPPTPLFQPPLRSSTPIQGARGTSRDRNVGGASGESVDTRPANAHSDPNYARAAQVTITTGATGSTVQISGVGAPPAPISPPSAPSAPTNASNEGEYPDNPGFWVQIGKQKPGTLHFNYVWRTNPNGNMPSGFWVHGSQLTQPQSINRPPKNIDSADLMWIPFDKKEEPVKLTDLQPKVQTLYPSNRRILKQSSSTPPAGQQNSPVNSLAVSAVNQIPIQPAQVDPTNPQGPPPGLLASLPSTQSGPSTIFWSGARQPQGQSSDGPVATTTINNQANQMASQQNTFYNSSQPADTEDRYVRTRGGGFRYNGGSRRRGRYFNNGRNGAPANHQDSHSSDARSDDRPRRGGAYRQYVRNGNGRSYDGPPHTGSYRARSRGGPYNTPGQHQQQHPGQGHHGQ